MNDMTIMMNEYYVIVINQCRYLPKAELNTKGGRLGSFWCSTRLLMSVKKCLVYRWKTCRSLDFCGRRSSILLTPCKFCVSSLLFSLRPSDVCAGTSSFSPRTCNFQRRDCHFRLDLAIFLLRACHFYFDLAIFDLRFLDQPVIFALTLRYLC